MTIERFFLRNLLRISLAGSSLILVTDLMLYAQDALSTGIDVVIVTACVLSFLLMKKYYTLSALIFTGLTLVAMVYQCFAAPMNTTTSMSIILILGFIFSILLKGRLLWVMHTITCLCIIAIFVAQTQIPALRVSPDASEILTIAITYGVLYGIISYGTPNTSSPLRANQQRTSYIFPVARWVSL